MTKKKLTVFCSGSGSNFKALHRHITEKKLPVEIALCVSNNSQCGAMMFAREQHIPAFHLSTKTHPDETQYVSALLDELAAKTIDLIALAGYMKKLPSAVVKRYAGKILNIHPSLLPKFGGEGMYGQFVHEAVIAAHEVESGATVHLVEEEYDKGKILVQRKVPVFPDDTAELLAARVLSVEHQIYPEALEMMLNGQA
jgi:phosphoribosylglycinamide formyltransferase 1